MTPLETLARRCGIALTINAMGAASSACRARRCKAFSPRSGVEADTEPRAVAALAERERQAWQAVVPPVVVAHEPEVAVEVTLPECDARRVVAAYSARTAPSAAAKRHSPISSSSARDDGDCRPGRRKERRRLALGSLPLGYHHLSIEPQSASCTVIVTPRRCFLPESVAERGLWGLALQLYLLRSERNLGVGDFGDLAAVARAVHAAAVATSWAEPAARAVPGRHGAREPVFAGEPSAVESAQHRRGGGARSLPVAAAAALLADAGVQAEVRSCAQPTRSTTAGSRL